MSHAGGSRGTRVAVATGIACIMAGLACNVWILTRLLSPDGDIEIPLLRLAVWAFDIGAVVAGSLFILFRRQFRNILVSVVTFLVFAPLILELGSRAYFRIKGRIAPRNGVFSPEIGWVMNPYVHLNAPFGGYGVIHFSTTRDGFRVFGDPASRRKKIFVIGDSFTKAFSASDGQTYYDHLGDGLEVFAYGGSGYGSLQEYMILDRYFDLIKPDLILWQFCPNDIYENSLELESYDYATSSRMTKPFLRNGRVEILFPHPSWVYRGLIRHSYLLRLIDLEYDILIAPGRRVRPVSPTHPLVCDAKRTTSEIMGLVKKRAGAVPVIAFATDDREFIDDDAFGEIARANGIRYIHGIPRLLAAAEKRGVVVNDAPRDFHWNSAGHALVGNAVREYLIRNGFTPSGKGAKGPPSGEGAGAR